MCIKDIIKRHDQLAFEMKLEFPVPKDNGKHNDYKVEMYLFVPQSLDINKQNYTKYEFYRALKTNIRLSTPEYLLRNIINGDSSPYSGLLNSIDNLMDDPEKEVYYVRKSGLKQINVERVYHLNLIMRYAYNNGSVIKAYRVVASKKGIKRIEKNS